MAACRSCHAPLTSGDSSTRSTLGEYHTRCFNLATERNERKARAFDNRILADDGLLVIARKPIGSEVTNVMATAANTPKRDVIDFAPNTPQTVALKFNQGKRIAGQYGERMMYTTPDNRLFFVSIEVASEIEALGINVRENFTITQRWDGHKDSPRTWEVARVAGPQLNGTLVVDKLPEEAPAIAKKPATSAAVSDRHTQLLDEANGLVDIFAAAWEHARTKHEGRVKPEDVRALVTTAYIQRGKQVA